MNYVGFINSLIRAKTATSGHLVMYGQNIAAGSCLSGLTGGLESKGGRLVLNTPNSENTLLGTGFGLMMADVNAIYFMKQQDFLLLGVDQLVNTYNLIRQRSNLASFTIVQIVVDSGFEGPQSAFNNLPDFCSIARVPGYTISNAHDAAKVIDRHLVSPGFRIIGVSQRLFRTEPIESADHVSWNDDGDVLRYSDGTDVTIAAFNFAFPQALELWRGFKERNIDGALFSINAAMPIDWQFILNSVRRTGRLVVLDDSKSANRPCHQLALAAGQICGPQAVLVCARRTGDADLRPNLDLFSVDHDEIICYLGLGLARSEMLRR